MTGRRFVQAAVGVVLGGWLLVAAGIRGAGATDVAPAFREDILRLLKATGTEKMMISAAQLISNNAMDMMVGQIADSDTTGRGRTLAVVKDEYGRIFEDELPKLIDEMVPLYAKHFTPDEVKGLTAFWESPLGKKMVQETPGLMNEGQALGLQWAQRLMPAAMDRVQKRLEKEGLAKK